MILRDLGDEEALYRFIVPFSRLRNSVRCNFPEWHFMQLIRRQGQTGDTTRFVALEHYQQVLHPRQALRFEHVRRTRLQCKSCSSTSRRFLIWQTRRRLEITGRAHPPASPPKQLAPDDQ